MLSVLFGTNREYHKNLNEIKFRFGKASRGARVGTSSSVPLLLIQTEDLRCETLLLDEHDSVHHPVQSKTASAVMDTLRAKHSKPKTPEAQ